MQNMKLSAMLAATTLVMACGGREVDVDSDELAAPSDRSCVYKGKVYQDQQEFQDGCNGCKCNPEGSTGVGCTMKLCDEAAPADEDGAVSDPPASDARTCTYNGKVYQDQEEFMDGCNGCKCNPEGTTGVGCTMVRCEASTCASNDECGAGASCKPQYDIGVDPWDACEAVGTDYTLCHFGDDDDCAAGYSCAYSDGLDDIKFGIGRCTPAAP